MNKNRLAEIVRFCIVGGVSFLVDAGSLYVCAEFLHMHYLFAAAVAFTIAVLFNYWLCVKFVFKNVGQQNAKQKSLFIGSSIVGLAINQVCMYVFVDLFGVYYMLAKILSTVVVTAWNYVMKRKAVMG